MTSPSKVKRTPKVPKTFPDPSMIVFPVKEQSADRSWQPTFNFIDEHDNIIVAVPHFTKRDLWVLPGGKERDKEALEKAGAKAGASILWSRFWT